MKIFAILFYKTLKDTTPFISRVFGDRRIDTISEINNSALSSMFVTPDSSKLLQINDRCAYVYNACFFYVILVMKRGNNPLEAEEIVKSMTGITFQLCPAFEGRVNTDQLLENYDKIITMIEEMVEDNGEYGTILDFNEQRVYNKITFQEEYSIQKDLGILDALSAAKNRFWGL